MSGELIPGARSSENALEPTGASVPLAAWQGLSTPQDSPAFNWGRYWSAVKRYKWLVLGIAILGTGIGVLLASLQKPEYEVNASVWVSMDQPSRNGGPIVAEDPMDASTWVNLLLSRRIVDNIVRKRHLYITPENPADTALFGNFDLAPTFGTGAYTLAVNSAGNEYVLMAGDKTIERGAVGDSIGRKIGFLWQPSTTMLRPGQTVEFTVVRPTSAAADIANRITGTMPERSSTLRLQLTGNDPQRAASTMNALLEEFVHVSTDLKRANYVEVVNTIGDQMQQADSLLHASQEAYQRFKVHTITLPSEGGALPAGAETSQGQNQNPMLAGDPVTANFMQLKVQQQSLQQDEQALEQVLAQAKSGTLTPDVFLAIPSVHTQGKALETVINKLYLKEDSLRAMRQIYTDDYKGVKDLQQEVTTLKAQTVPTLTRQLIGQLKAQDAELQNRINGSSRELQKIPARTIEEMRLQNDMLIAQQLANRLRTNLQEAKLAELSVTPEVQVLDTAIAPAMPTNAQAGFRILFMAVAMGLAGGIGLAFLLDRVDPRIRYPEQVTHEMGLNILGAVPHIRKQKDGVLDPEETAQVIESFRTIRLNLAHEHMGGSPIIFTVTSPGPGDGKSLVSANLALSFAEAGYRTVLVDGDIRRGELHAMFGLDRRPGLTDYLIGEAPLDTVLRDSSHENLSVLPCGTRRHRGPELLVSEGLAHLMAELQRRADVVIVDSPPLGAGVDPFIMATATKNMLMVLRTGISDRKMAEAKLTLVDRLPVRVVGVVLNDIRQAGAYRYYSYLYGYSVVDEDVPQLESEVGALTGKRS
ncbi:MAG TPA: polysaccharide biosynthesis tyrosine autokinase [Gemmatimonadaceae bacterium]